MAWLHTWTGLVVGWVLFFIFVTGTVGYFYVEVDRWMRPELPLRAKPISPYSAVAQGEAYLRHAASGADSWAIVLPGSRETPYLRVSWRDAHTRAEPPEQLPAGEDDAGLDSASAVIIDPQTGHAQRPVPRDTGGGLLLEQMHWALHYMPLAAASWIVVACTMIMFVALVTGVITHKKIFTDFFTFRPGKGQRSWLDIHNVLSVTSLPFFLLITLSGLMFFLYTLMPLVPRLVYGEVPSLPTELRAPTIARAGSASPLLALTTALSIGERYFGPDGVRRIDVEFPDDAAARISLTPRSGKHLSDEPVLRLNGVSGLVLDPPRARPPGVVVDIWATLITLHIGGFADSALRWLYFIAGALGCAMIATGLILWTVKRRAKHVGEGRSSFGHQLVERLNVGTIAGLPVAVAFYFWANRLIPAAVAGRRDWEVHAMFLGWAILLLYTGFRPVTRAWIEELWLAAAAFGLLPLLNFFTTERHLGVTLVHGDWPLAGVDLTSLVFAGVFGIAAIQMTRYAKRTARSASLLAGSGSSKSRRAVAVPRHADP